MGVEEQNFQIACVNWYNYQYPDRRLYSNYNNPRNAIAGKIAKAMGLRAGVADLTLMLEGGRVLYIELKTEKGVQRKEQKEFKLLCDSTGAPYHLIRTFDEFVALIESVK